MDQNFNNSSNSTILRLNNLEERISSQEKMLRYLDEFIHLKEEEKSNNQLNSSIEPLLTKINKLENEVKILKDEKEQSQNIITELNNKINYLEEQMQKYNCNNMNDIIYSLSDKERQLNLLIKDFSDMTKETNLMINNKMDDKFNEFKIFNENRINELLLLIEDINNIIEENEKKINKVEKDNLNIIKFISVQEQKVNGFDVLNNEIINIKQKIFSLKNENMKKGNKNISNLLI